jgi:hypothetical protein
METTRYRMLVNLLQHPHLASRFSKSDDMSFEGLISELTFQEFEVLAENLRISVHTSTNPEKQQGA